MGFEAFNKGAFKPGPIGTGLPDMMFPEPGETCQSSFMARFIPFQPMRGPQESSWPGSVYGHFLCMPCLTKLS